MDPYADHDLPLEPAWDTSRAYFEALRARCLRIAAATFVAGTAGTVFLCLSGLTPAAVAIPVFLAVMSLLLAAVSAALFARIARLCLEDVDPDAEDDGGGPGRGWDRPPDPPEGGDLEFDWERFERAFRSYCERPAAIRA